MSATRRGDRWIPPGQLDMALDPRLGGDRDSVASAMSRFDPCILPLGQPSPLHPRFESFCSRRNIYLQLLPSPSALPLAGAGSTGFP